MDGLKFSWDARKNSSNQKKHGISFEETKSVFLDDFARLIPDPDHSKVKIDLYYLDIVINQDFLLYVIAIWN